MIKVAIIGCGKQADAHATLIRRLKGCEIVGVCDSEKLMARQLHERFNVPSYFDNVVELLERTSPDVVHITTPPQSHLQLGRVCLDAGCHVFFEKPFALCTAEAEELIALAGQKGRKITVGHNNQFSNVAVRMRELVRSGALGGHPVHMESVWGYDLGDRRFAQALLGDKTHWIRRLPGALLHNIISHGVSKIAEFLRGPRPTVTARGLTSPLLQRIQETDIVDELRVTIDDEYGTTAYFTFTTQVQPLIRQFRVYGPKGSLVTDDMHETLIVLCRTDYKSYLNHVVPPSLYASQQLRGALGNLRRFFSRELTLDGGRERLTEGFYRSVAEGGDVPIPYVEILRTSRIMDAIFAQVMVKPERALALESVR